MSKRPPDCPSGHGRMVPTGEEFAFVRGGVVTALVEWQKPGAHMRSLVYSPSDEATATLPRLGPGMGDVVYDLMRSRSLSLPAIFTDA